MKRFEFEATIPAVEDGILNSLEESDKGYRIIKAFAISDEGISCATYVEAEIKEIGSYPINDESFIGSITIDHAISPADIYVLEEPGKNASFEILAIYHKLLGCLLTLQNLIACEINIYSNEEWVNFIKKEEEMIPEDEGNKWFLNRARSLTCRNLTLNLGETRAVLLAEAYFLDGFEWDYLTWFNKRTEIDWSDLGEC